MLSTERRCHDVHVLFGDVRYDVRNVQLRVKKIKEKENLLFFSEYHKKCSSRVMKTFKFKILMFSFHSMTIFMVFTAKRVNILYIFGYPNAPSEDSD